MSEAVVGRFRRWFEYERDAFQLALASLTTVPADRRASAEYAKAVAVLGHLVTARAMWLFRTGAGPQPATGFDVLATDPGAVAADWEVVAGRWAEYLGRIDDDDAAREFEYRSFEGDRYRNRVEDVLAQLFGHSSYHRGHVAMLVRQAGGTPAETDFVFWCRRPA